MLNDEVIKELYVKFDIPADRLVIDPVKMGNFRLAYANATSHIPSSPSIARIIIQLRKLGLAKGGLPRIRKNLAKEAV
jgi:hypothetical protein